MFRRPEDFARCYTVSARKFAELKPYIRIGESYRIPEEKPERVVPGPEVSTPDRGPDSPETEAAVSEDRTGGSGSRVLGSETPVPDGPVELNGADSATLVALRGIGPLTAGRIVQYRDRLGGFVQIEQVLEVQGVREENYRMFSTQIFVDSSKIQKIDINFATPEQLAGHPYLPPRVLDRILKHRQLKGGWSHTGELVEQHILSREQAAKLAPYLHFGPR